MPYITPDARAFYEPELTRLGTRVHGDVIGGLTYVLTKLLLAWVGESPTYARYALVVGAIETAKMELYRKAVALYEDQKCAENGEVFSEECKHPRIATQVCTDGEVSVCLLCGKTSTTTPALSAAIKEILR
jgi:hypothetical protein